MSELSVRLIVVGLVVVVTLAIVYILNRRGLSMTEDRRRVDLDPGTYLFSSTGCADCDPVRQRLATSLGSSGYREFVWEEEPNPFTEYRIDRVPATMVVEPGGKATVTYGTIDDSFSA